MKKEAAVSCVVVLLGVSLIAVGCAKPEVVSLKGKPIAAVIGDTRHDRAFLSLIDLESFKVAHVTRLRSLTMDIAANTKERIVASAQCGGLDQDVDEVLGILDVDDPSGGVRYLKLPFPNPYDIEFTAGRFNVVHGFVQGDDLRFSTVDETAGRAVAIGGVSIRTGRPAAVGNAFYIPVFDAGGEKGRVAVARITAESKVSTLGVYPGRAAVVSQDLDPDAKSLVLFQLNSGRDAVRKGWSVAEVDTYTGRVMRREPVAGIDYTVGQTCVFGKSIALTDADQMDPEDPGREVIVLDRGTLQEKYRFTVEGTPVSLAAWKDSLLVIDGVSEELLLYPDGATKPTKRVRFGEGSSPSNAIAVLP